MKAKLTISALALSALNASLGKVQELLGYVPKAQITSAYTATVNGDPFTVVHNLGVTPVTAFALPYAQCDVWATQADRDVWDATKIVLRGAVANTKVDLLILSAT